MKHTSQQGFTLIELIVVIIILGILSATALPKFIDLQSDAEVAAAQGLAGGIASSASVAYSGDKAKGTSDYTAAKACDGSLSVGFSLGKNCSTTLTAASGSTPASCKVTCGSASATVSLP